MANDIKLYRVALSHKSMSIKDGKGHKLNNERLEFLGDAIINMSVAHHLFSYFKDAPEGLLTMTRTKLVNRQYMNKTAIELHIDQLIRKEKNVVSPQNNLFGNSLEAIIGAIYLDRGYRISNQFVVKWLIKSPEHLNEIVHTETNHKARLIEWCQKNGKYYSFKLVSEKKDDRKHILFEVEAFVDDVYYGRGIGRTIKEAEQHASEEALHQIKD